MKIYRISESIFDEINEIFDMIDSEESVKSYDDYGVEPLARDRLGKDYIDTLYDNGREARGTCTCPGCNEVVKWTACSDVGGVWVWCDECGMQDL